MILKPCSFAAPFSFALAVALVLCLFPARTANAQQDKPEMPEEYRGRVRAPELTGHRGWLNTEQPLSLAALKGKVVLLDFWTYGCINCIHVIPDLKRLEEKYADQLVVIGVHSAKFENEKETDNIRQIILRYEIEHPVVNDADFAIWQAYAVRAWPTQYLIDPAGYIVGRVEGEGNYETIDQAIAKTVEEFRKRGELNEQPLKLALERAKVGDLPLAFPGKILADAKGHRLFIADSNHNRIVVTKLDGTVIETIGTGERGLKDGAFDTAIFYRPQGMALADGDTLYVADTENHAIRRVDLNAKTVSTIAGTGEQSQSYEFEPVAAKRAALNSPWDLQLVGRTLYIAMAGPHQIWQLKLDKNLASVFAGSGREARIDGARIGPPVSRPDGTPAGSAFAQPSGLTTDGQMLYVADSESNIIRAISLSDRVLETTTARLPTAQERGALANANDPATVVSDDAPAAPAVPQVRTLAGGDLFEFGDRDGAGDDVRLQHPLGVCYREGALYIADTYNHKIKKLDLRTRTVKTFAGTGRPGQTDGQTPAFYEPGGLSIAHGKLYIADTNNHAVRTVNLKTGETATLKLTGLRPPQSSAAKDEKVAEVSSPPNAVEITLAPQRLNLSNDNALVVEVALPAGYHLNESAPQRVKVAIEKGAQHLALADNQPSLTRAGKDVLLPLRLPLRALTPGAAELRVQAALYYCREDNTGTCRIKTLIWRVPVEVTTEASAPREIKAQGKIE